MNYFFSVFIFSMCASFCFGMDKQREVLQEGFWALELVNNAKTDAERNDYLKRLGEKAPEVVQYITDATGDATFKKLVAKQDATGFKLSDLDETLERLQEAVVRASYPENVADAILSQQQPRGLLAKDINLLNNTSVVLTQPHTPWINPVKSNDSYSPEKKRSPLQNVSNIIPNSGDTRGKLLGDMLHPYDWDGYKPAKENRPRVFGLPLITRKSVNK